MTKDHATTNPTKTSSKLVDEYPLNTFSVETQKEITVLIEEARQEGYKAGFIKAGLQGERNRIIEQIRVEESNKLLEMIEKLTILNPHNGELRFYNKALRDLLKALNIE